MQVSGQAFLLRMDMSPEGKPRDGAEGTELREPLRTAALEAGLSRMRRPPFIPYALPALEATEYAKEEGKFDEFHKACYVAYWEESQDIGRLGVLEAVARECGLDWARLEPRLKSEHYRKEVLRQYGEGMRIGFTGIPGFIIGNNGFTGAAPYETFRLAAERAMPLVRPDEKPASPG